MAGPLEHRIAEARRWLELLDPDVACFQELVYSEGDPESHFGIWKGLGYEIAFCPIVEFGDAGTLGNGIITRLPVEAADYSRLPGLDDDENRHVQVATLQLPAGGAVNIYNTHLNWRPHQGYIREAQVQALHAFVVETLGDPPPGSQPPIICGDFNAEPDSTEIRFLAGLATLGGTSVAYLDVWRGADGRGPGNTWDNRNQFAAANREPDRRLDYIWAGVPKSNAGRGKLFHARVVCDEALTGTFASDHFGVYGEVLL